VFDRGFGLGFALALAQSEAGWRRDGYVELRVSTARASVWAVFVDDDVSAEHAELLAFALDCGLYFGIQGESEQPRSLARLEALMDDLFAGPEPVDPDVAGGVADQAMPETVPIARDFPIGTGWIEGPREGKTHEGVFNGRPDGVTFIPLEGFPEHWQHRLYFWRQFSEATAIPAGRMAGATSAHSVMLELGRPDELVVSHLDLTWGGNDVVIIPLAPFTVDDWLRRFRTAGVRITGVGEERMARMAAGGVPEGDARWRRDPTGRHDHRYWDGVAWTRHVSDKGQRATDAL
jgi:hypothetical protein